MHPGDVRMLLAIDVPELRGQKNVLLFSQHGERPESNKMAGSDLDGDEYAITWDQRLFLGEWNQCTLNNGSFWSKNGRELRIRYIMESARRLQEVNCCPLDYDKLSNETLHDRITSEALVKH
jgi:RNA dependent RNA polymerase